MNNLPRLVPTLITRRPALDALVPAWRDLLEHGNANEPTLSPEWLLSWWEVYGPRQGRQLCVVRFDLDGQLVGLAPLLRRRHWYWPAVPFRRLEPLASGESEADAVCSDYLNVIARRSHEASVAACLASALAEGTLGHWDELVMPLMAGDNPMPNLLAEAGKARRLLAEITQTTEAPHIPLPASWDAYLKALDRKDRYLINRTLRDFEAWAGTEAVFHRVATPEQLGQGKQILRSLHQERWEGSGGGTFRSPLFLAFHDAVMPRMLALGALELIWLTVRSEPVSAMYSIRWAGKVHFYQCGRKTDLPRGIRPGGVLLYHAIRSAIESGLREFDFLGGTAVYKSQLSLASRPLLQLRLTRGSTLEQARLLGEAVKDRLRPLVRCFRPSRTPNSTTT